MNSLDRFLFRIDRRVIFLVIFLVVLFPLLFPFRLPTRVMPPVQKLFDAIERIDPRQQALIISVDYDPQTEPELQPMLVALLRHAFARRVPVLVLALYVQGLGLAQAGLTTVTDEFNARATSHADSIVYGRDYVFLGWQPPPIVPILGMGESISAVFPQDYGGNRTDTLELMRRIRNYRDVGILVTLAASNVPASWIAYAQTRFGLKIGTGMTGVMAADFYPYLQTGQFSGLIAGMKGGAEYEELVENRLGVVGRRRATQAMGSQTAAHLAVMVLVILGNVGFFVARRKGRK